MFCLRKRGEVKKYIMKSAEYKYGQDAPCGNRNHAPDVIESCQQFWKSIKSSTEAKKEESCKYNCKEATTNNMCKY